MSNRKSLAPMDGLLDIDEDDKKIEAYADRAGIPKLPTAKPVAVPTPKREPARGKLTKVSLEIPDYVMKELKRQSFEQECSVRHLILKALNESKTVVVDTDDLVADRRRR